jgi:hypothetical protein
LSVPKQDENVIESVLELFLGGTFAAYPHLLIDKLGFSGPSPIANVSLALLIAYADFGDGESK